MAPRNIPTIMEYPSILKASHTGKYYAHKYPCMAPAFPNETQEEFPSWIHLGFKRFIR
jgi:hypothetical protein